MHRGSDILHRSYKYLHVSYFPLYDFEPYLISRLAPYRITGPSPLNRNNVLMKLFTFWLPES